MMVSEEDIKPVLRAYNEVFKTGEPNKGFEYRILLKDGRKMYVESSISLRKNDQGEIIGFRSISRDVTERKMAEEKIERIAREWQTTFDSITDLVSIQDNDCKLVRVNKAYADTFQMTPEELAGRHCYEIVHKASCPMGGCPHLEALKTRTSITRELFEPLLGAYLEVSCSPVIKDDGEIAGTIHIAKNITARKEIEHRVRERMKELKAFYGLAEITATEGITLDNLYQEVVNILPASWQYPEIACARILIGDNEFRTNNFRDPAWVQSSPVKVNGTEVGKIEIGYLEEKPEIDEGPFLKVERKLLNAIAERVGHITGSTQSEDALRKSEELYRSLFENMLNGFAYCKMLFEQDQPVDFIYLSVNDAFEKQTGLRDVAGKKVSEVIPGIQESDPLLIETYGRVALTGIAERLEIYLNALDMWLSISIYSPQKEYFVAIFDVITERKRDEEDLRKAGEKYRSLVENINDIFYILDNS